MAPRRQIRSRATIVVTARDRFSLAIESLTAVVGSIKTPHDLIYIDAGAPPEISARIAEICAANAYRHVRLDDWLSPNQARNLGHSLVDTDYVVFLENNMIPAPGWLEAMIVCADETKAEVVTPLICENEPLHTIIHHAGGAFTTSIETFLSEPLAVRRMREVSLAQGKRVTSTHRDRGVVQNCELHCLLVNTRYLRQLGGLDEGMMGLKDHIDLSLSVWSNGGSIMFEPQAVLTTLLTTEDRPLHPEDREYYALRWSPEWQRRSLARLQEKWGMLGDPEIHHLRERMEGRLSEALSPPFIDSLPLVRDIAPARDLITRLATPVFVRWSERLAREFDEHAPRDSSSLVVVVE